VSASGRIAFVPARFGPEIIGGAEIVMRQLAWGFRDRGWEVEILTTCAVDHFRWDNVLPAGVSKDDGLTVHRFPAVVSTPGAERAALESAILSGIPLTVQEQYRWLNDGMRVPELFHHLLDNGRDYAAVVLGPYMFWPAVACSQIIPERSVLWTCLHDEPFAYLELFRPMLTGVAGLLLQSPPEHDLLHRLVGQPARHEVTGCGVEVPDGYDPDGFRERHHLGGRRLLLYAGRREGAKGWDRLLEAFAAATVRRRLPFTLVTIGAGEVRPPAEIADRVVDLGFLPDPERDNAFAAAEAYLQPGAYEAFSRTIMEAWLAGIPVIATGASDVLRYHCEQSGAGLIYEDGYEFEECLAFLAEQPRAARRLAAPGRGYVLDNYQWPAVIGRVEAAVLSWTQR
jgi:glycosyltransferase involved in cell wall biosynthesis